MINIIRSKWVIVKGKETVVKEYLHCRTNPAVTKDHRMVKSETQWA